MRTQMVVLIWQCTGRKQSNVQLHEGTIRDQALCFICVDTTHIRVLDYQDTTRTHGYTCVRKIVAILLDVGFLNEYSVS